MPKGEKYWKQQYASVARRAFELHVLELICGYAPLAEAAYQDIQGAEDNPLFREAELIGKYPDTRVRIQMYDRVRDRTMSKNYRIWEPEFAHGEDPPDVENMRSPDRIAGDMMMWAQGG